MAAPTPTKVHGIDLATHMQRIWLAEWRMWMGSAGSWMGSLGLSISFLFVFLFDLPSGHLNRLEKYPFTMTLESKEVAMLALVNYFYPSSVSFFRSVCVLLLMATATVRAPTAAPTHVWRPPASGPSNLQHGEPRR